MDGTKIARELKKQIKENHPDMPYVPTIPEIYIVLQEFVIFLKKQAHSKYQNWWETFFGLLLFVRIKNPRPYLKNPQHPELGTKMSGYKKQVYFRFARKWELKMDDLERGKDNESENTDEI